MQDKMEIDFVTKESDNYHMIRFYEKKQYEGLRVVKSWGERDRREIFCVERPRSGKSPKFTKRARKLFEG